MDEKESIPSKLWDVVTTLTDSAQQAAVRKAQEAGHDLDAGQIPFQETLINLSHDRDVLRDAVEKGRIVQLPLKLQYRLLAETTKVKSQLDALTSGTDAVVPLETAVEDLNATIWQLNLQNLSPEILAFDGKMNDLKSQEVQIKKILGDAKKVESSIAKLGELQASVIEQSTKVSELALSAEEAATKIGAVTQQCEEAERTVLAVSSVVKEHESDIASSAALARDSNAEISVAKTRWEEISAEIGGLRDGYSETKANIDELLSSAHQALDESKQAYEESFKATDENLRSEVASLVKEAKDSIGAAVEEATSNYRSLEEAAENSENTRQSRAKAQLTESVEQFETAEAKVLSDYKTSVKSLEEESRSNIEEHDKEAKRLTDQLNELEGRIRESIERATGYTLFHSFQRRQVDLVASKNIWAWALLACVVGSVALTCYLIHTVSGVHSLDTLFFVKLSISLPLIFAISFCSVQYSRERRLEEEYAFKSAISISLEPYQKLVGQLVNESDAAEKAKYTAFIISSINRVFTSPTGLVFDDQEKAEGGVAADLLKTAGDVAQTLIKSKAK